MSKKLQSYGPKQNIFPNSFGLQFASVAGCVYFFLCKAMFAGDISLGQKPIISVGHVKSLHMTFAVVGMFAFEG